MSVKFLQPAGTHDFDPNTMLKRHYIIDILQSTFKQYGFLPIETPAIEHLDTLTGKYGQEGDQLLFKILKSGDFLAKTTIEEYRQGYQTVLPKIAKKGLRYDLTIPLARYIATHKNTINFPFKRFQTQPVWRAEKPQKGRYREFYQCDIDIIGNSSLLCEAEILAMTYQIANRLHINNFTIQLNHRLVFKALADQIKAPEKEIILCRTLDKLDKIGKEEVIKTLYKEGLSEGQVKQISWIFNLQGTTEDCIQVFTEHIAAHPAGQKALSDLKQILHYTEALLLPQNLISLTPTLARGLDYYTGAIFEMKAIDNQLSIAGGGRYDELTSLFDLPSTPSVGLSFGLDRLYDFLEKNNLLPADTLIVTRLLLVPLTKNEEGFALNYLNRLRKKDIATEIYLADHRPQKALKYAHKKNIPWVVIIGEEEVKKSIFSIKYMPTGQQKKCTFKELIELIKNNPK